VLGDKPGNCIQFVSGKTSVLRQRYRRKPELGNLPISLHVDVRRLTPIRTE
jgi:hypothetical protein